jgi:hypothetical protein
MEGSRVEPGAFSVAKGCEDPKHAKQGFGLHVEPIIYRRIIFIAYMFIFISASCTYVLYRYPHLESDNALMRVPGARKQSTA